jgi:hypothetical protein
MSELILNAQVFATQAHARISQTRKYTNQPYDVHLKAVADLVSEVTDDPEMIAAAWLHDVVEDTPATLGDVERAFGPSVAALVEQLTDASLPSSGNRGQRMAINRKHTATASAKAKTIKLADLIDNSRDICKHDPHFASTFLEEMAALLEVLGDGDGRLLQKARAMLADCSERLGLGNTPIGPRAAAPGWFLLDQNISSQYPKVLRRFARTFCADDLSELLPPSKAYIVASLRTDQIVEGDAPLSDVIEILTRHDFCYVGRAGNVERVIQRSDMQKPIARMWLFGLITVVELLLTRLVRELWPDDEWTKFVSANRLRKAEELRSERLRRQQSCTLLDCLQLGDKGAILLRNPAQLAAFGFESRRAGERVMRDLQSLRNNLAHSQDIVTNDWPQIVRLARRLETLVAEEP